MSPLLSGLDVTCMRPEAPARAIGGIGGASGPPAPRPRAGRGPL